MDIHDTFNESHFTRAVMTTRTYHWVCHKEKNVYSDGFTHLITFTPPLGKPLFQTKLTGIGSIYSSSTPNSIDDVVLNMGIFAYTFNQAESLKSCGG